MRGLIGIALGLAAGTLIACSGAPSDDSPDYEVDITSRPPDKTGGATPEDPASGDPAAPGGGSEDEVPVGNGGGGADAGADAAPAPKPTSVSLTIDGTKFNVSSTDIWAEVRGAGDYDLFIKVTGPGVPAGSDIHISATGVRTGCDNTANFITYRPENDTQYMPKSTKDPNCGLSITSLPKVVNGRFTGRFEATLYGINTATPKTKTVDLSFDVLRTK